MERRHLYRDSLLATAASLTLLLGVSVYNIDSRILVDPLLVSAGCVGMVGIEVLLLRVPDLTQRLWERSAVRVASTLGVLVGGGLAMVVGVTWVVAVLVWGLLAYVALVGVVVLTGRNPLDRLV